MPIVKKKLSTSGYVLIALAIIAAIALPILHVVGVIDLSFLGTGFENIMMWAATEPLNGVILISGAFIGGALTFYALKTYLIGTQINTSTVQPYIPTGQQISNTPQQQEETVVSE